MVPASSKSFITKALLARGPKSLSYIHSNLRWLIRKHLLALLDGFPLLSPHVGEYFHDDGLSVRLLYVKGNLPLLISSSSLASVPITVWLHQAYPYYAPLVFIDASFIIIRDHPFVNSSGETMTPYLKEWNYPDSNLLDLVGNLAKALSLCPPYASTSLNSCEDSINLSPSSMREVSKREARDRLITRLHHDFVNLRTKIDEEIDKLTSAQPKLQEREKSIAAGITELEKELGGLEISSLDLKVQRNSLFSWLEDNKRLLPLPTDEVEGFEASDTESRVLLENEAADRAIDEVVDALDGALEAKAVTFEDYVKQVRALSREQFQYRAIVKAAKNYP